MYAWSLGSKAHKTYRAPLKTGLYQQSVHLLDWSIQFTCRNEDAQLVTHNTQAKHNIFWSNPKLQSYSSWSNIHQGDCSDPQNSPHTCNLKSFYRVDSYISQYVLPYPFWGVNVLRPSTCMPTDLCHGTCRTFAFHISHFHFTSHICIG